MIKQILSEEFRRMQKIAGIITENVSQEIQALIDKNDFLKGKVTASSSDIVEGDKFVLLFSEDSAKHIAERHLDGNKPGSLFKSGVNLRDVAKKILNTSPSEQTGGRVKWLGVNGGEVGKMGVAKSSPEEVAKIKDYTMPDGGKEQVRIAPGKRKPTSEVSLITAELGTLGNGKKALSMITMFPGGMKVDGVEIPMDRGQFASKGLYFVVDPSSSLIKENKNSPFYFFFDLDGVLADMEKGLQQSPEIIILRKILDDLINNNFPEYKNLVDDKIKEKIKIDLPSDAPSNHPLRPLKKAFNNYVNKIFSVASKESFYKNLSLMPGAKEMLKKAQEISGKKPNILSSPVQGENTSVQEKKDWVNTNFGDLIDKIIIDTDKGKYAKSKNDILIDDRPKYVNAFESAGGSAILHKDYKDTIKEMEKFKQSLIENKNNIFIINKNKMKKQILSEQFRRMQKLAGIITETVDKALETKLGLLLKDPNIKTSINNLIKDMPAEPKGSTMTKLPDDKIHITLTSIKSSKPFKDKLKDFQLPKDIEFPNVKLGNAEFVYREDGKTTYVAAVENQNDIKEFVDKIYQKIGETNPEPNRFFHITLANNQGGDPFKSIGNVEKSDLIKENILKIINEVLKKYRKQLNEEEEENILNISNNNYKLPDFEEKKTALNQMFLYGSINADHYQHFGYDSEKELEDAIGFGEVDSSRITNAIQNATKTIFPEKEGFKVEATLYYGDKKGNVSIVKGDDTLGFDINISL